MVEDNEGLGDDVTRAQIDVTNEAGTSGIQKPTEHEAELHNTHTQWVS